MLDKVFEALKRIETVFPLNKEGKPNVYKEYTNSVEPFYNDFDLVLNALTELQAIKEAKSNEAIECLEKLGTHRIEYREGFELGFTKTMPFKSTMEYKIINQALLKAEKLEKAWGILKKSLGFNFYSKTREVEVYDLEDEEDYCFLTNKDDGSSLLPQEEFDLLKEMLK